ncbi:hypothetical protein IFR05_005352 [Cadophora sp. M221]|nr:hypothetical protein IFR05_005352 [Cadophora sp. M221]
MDEIELEARRTTLQGQYDILSQQDQDPRPPQIGDNKFEAKAPEIHSRLRTSDLMSKLLPSKVKPVDSGSKLPPKSFSQAPIFKRILKHIATATAALIMVGIPIGILILCSNDFVQGDTYCTSTGVYASIDATHSGSISSIFNINIVYGSLSFGKAKFIDLVWDITFSRCGQALLGWIAYRVNAAALLRIMETQPVSYNLFSSLSLSWSSIATLGPVTKAFFTKLGWRKKFLLLWILLNILWVAFWPTITNAMTGYIAKNDTLVKIVNGTGYANFTELASTTYLGFRFYGLNNSGNVAKRTKVIIGPVLLSSGPNETLWDELYQRRILAPGSLSCMG